MRRLPALATFCLGLALPGGALAESVSKPLRAAVPAKAGQTIALENLAGALEIVAGQGAEAVLTGKAYADAGPASESQGLLDAVRVETGNEGGGPTLHVTYPVDRSPFGYRREGEGSRWSRSSSTVEYQGRRVEVIEGGSAKPLLYADLKLEVPPGVAVRVGNHVGRVTARGVGGALEVRTASADVDASDVAGGLEIRTGSGDVRAGGAGGLDVSTGSGDVTADRIRGGVSVSTGSGDVRLARVEGPGIAIRTGSGDLSLDEVAGSLELQTGSGDITGHALRGVERLEVQTGSGQVTLSLDAAKLAGGEIDAASGDVRISLGSAPALTLSVSTTSGDIDAENLPGTRVTRRTGRRLEADVNGGGASLRIHTASGDVSVR